MAFRFKKAWGISVTELIEEKQGKISTTYVADSLVKFSAGLPTQVSGQTDAATHLVVNVNSRPYSGEGLGNTGDPTVPIRPASSLATTTLGERVNLIPLAQNCLFNVDITPLINAATATGGSLNTIVLPYAGNTSDFNGGWVYIADLAWQANIITSVVAGGAVTITFSPPALVAVTAGMIGSAVCYGFGSQVKLDATNPHLTISNAFADLGAGPCIVRGVNLRNATADVQFKQLI